MYANNRAPLSEVVRNLEAVTSRIKDASARWQRDPKDITIVAVSKRQPDERVHAALEAGHRVFGENRVQEAAGRWPDLKSRHPDIELHLIGPLQTNKIREAVELFDVIETVDREKLAGKLDREMQAQGRRMRCMIQVNTGEETQKAGVLPAEADAFIVRCLKRPGLDVRGLMCIPPISEDPAPHFALLAKIAGRHGLGELSMGMTSDFEVAIQFGATHVRVGTAIFGERAD